MIWMYLIVATYVLGGVCVLVAMAADAKRTKEKWPWQSWPLAFALWAPILAIVLVKSLARWERS